MLQLNFNQVIIVALWCLVTCYAYHVQTHEDHAAQYHQHDRHGDAIAFPGELHRRAPENHRTPPINSSNYMIPPVDFIQKISNYSVSDLLLNFVDDYEEDELLASRFGPNVERSSAITPKSAPCIPELQTIKLVPENADSTVVYIPSCTRIERCGGCCSHNLLSCQPTETELVSYKVIKTQFAAGNRLKYVGKELIHVEKHTKCHCGCKIQPSDCSAVQKYSEQECKCNCANADEERKCHASSGKKLWDYTTCSCQCRNVINCSTGFMFDAIHCRCMPIPKRRHIVHPEDVPDEEDKQRPVPFTFQVQEDDYD